MSAGWVKWNPNYFHTKLNLTSVRINVTAIYTTGTVLEIIFKHYKYKLVFSLNPSMFNPQASTRFYFFDYSGQNSEREVKTSSKISTMKYRNPFNKSDGLHLRFSNTHAVIFRQHKSELAGS